MNAGGGPGILRLGGVDKLPVALPSLQKTMKLRKIINCFQTKS